MGIQKYVFYSIHNCDKHPEVPLMEIKYCTEKFLKDSGLTHIIIRLCGFMQVNVTQIEILIMLLNIVSAYFSLQFFCQLDKFDYSPTLLIILHTTPVHALLHNI